MVAKCCLYCGSIAQFTLRAGPFPNQDGTAVIVEQCQNDDCLNHVYFRYDHYADSLKPSPAYSDMYPFANTQPPQELPADVAVPFREALSSLSARNWNAALVMCRRSLEEAIMQFGAQGNSLQAQIEDLTSKGILTPTIRDWAHETRLGGNLGAHGSSTQKWAAQEDAEEIVEFARSIFQYVYIIPSQVQQRRLRLSRTP